MKRLLKKATESKEDPFLAILNYRAAPLECGRSLAELLMNRKLRTRLLSTENLVRGDNKAEDRKEKYGIRQRRNYDKSARPLPQLAENDIVRVRRGSEWGPMAKVLRETSPMGPMKWRQNRGVSCDGTDDTSWPCQASHPSRQD